MHPLTSPGMDSLCGHDVSGIASGYCFERILLKFKLSLLLGADSSGPACVRTRVELGRVTAKRSHRGHPSRDTLKRGGPGAGRSICDALLG